MLDYDRIDAYLEQNLDQSLTELGALVAQPSVGAQNWGLAECAALVRGMLEKRGFQADVLATKGAPVVFGERRGKNPKTLLFYNHYDVQPPEPLELWDSPPFEPARRDGMMFGRGISDDKGHIVARLFAIDAILETAKDLPCSVKFCIEGEEETSSRNLHEFVLREKDRLRADGCVWEFGYLDHLGTPLQILGLRGICYVELSVETASVDTHSGVGGSIFPNAAWRLTWALASLKGPDERIRIPGHYDDVIPPTERDRAWMAQVAETADLYRKIYGVRGFLKGITGGPELRIREVFEPTCTICGLTSGYQGPMSKTVLPARASAKVDFRLVPDMRPERVLKNLREHLDREGFEDVKIEFLGGEPPGRSNPDDPLVKTVVDAAEPVYGKKMQIVPMVGGSGPVHMFLHDLGLTVVTAGLGYPGTKAHAPNENIVVDHYLKHAKHVARILGEFAK